MNSEDIHFNSNLTASQKTNQGSYYTPKELVDMVHDWITPYLTEETIILDSTAGYGAFLEKSTNNKTCGIDLDPDAVDKLSKFTHVKSFHSNALESLGRSPWEIPIEKPLVVIGNPPYNDVTSKNKRAEKTERLTVHPKLKSRDYGVAFLKSYCELNADIVCVLHPLAYLIKKANFAQLKQFSGNYKLLKASVFSSALFPDTRGTPFPVVVALYQRNAFGMEYQEIMNFDFEIYDKPNTTFSFQEIETIDDYIRKYPPTKAMNPVSDIGLYFYSIRDTNSLLTSANFSEKEKFDRQITINYEHFYQYAYLSCYKRYFGKDYLFGNLSPLVKKKDLEQDFLFQSICCVNTVINNSKIELFKKDSFLKRLKCDISRKLNADDLSQSHALELKTWLDNREISKNCYQHYFRNYFDELRKSVLSQNS